MSDSETHMLAYWIEDKGIETAFEDYYPILAQNDPQIQHSLMALRTAKAALMARVNELVREAQDAMEDEDGPR